MAPATARFRVPASAMASMLFTSHGVPWLVGAALVVAALVAAGAAFDVRFYMIALMVVLIIVPMAGAFLYLNHGLRQATALNTVDHRLVLTPEGLEVTVFPPRVIEDTTVFDLRAVREAPPVSRQGPRRVVFSYGELQPYSVGLTEVRLPVGRHREKGMIVIPVSAFRCAGDMRLFTDSLAGRCGWKMAE